MHIRVLATVKFVVGFDMVVKVLYPTAANQSR